MPSPEKTSNGTYYILNKGIKVLYYLFLAVPIFYVAVATFSYYSVFHSLGSEPSTYDYTYKIAAERNVPLNTFPVSWGNKLIWVWVWSLVYLMPVVTISVFVLSRFYKKLRFPKYLVLSVILAYGVSYGLMWTEQFGGWYFQFVLD